MSKFDDYENPEMMECAYMIAESLRAISHGDTYGPTGFEALSMALAGDGLSKPVSDAMSEIADAIHEHASALHRIADALEKKTEVSE